MHFIISVGAMFLLVNLPFYNYQRLINDNDFYYNCITLSSIIGGFLFTGISILISALDKDRINRLWENNYLDNTKSDHLNPVLIYSILENSIRNNNDTAALSAFNCL